MIATESNPLLESSFMEKPLLLSSTDCLSAIVSRYLTCYLEEHKDHLPVGQLYAVVMGEIEKSLLTETMKFTNGNQKKASEILGINRNTLRKKISEDS